MTATIKAKLAYGKRSNIRTSDVNHSYAELLRLIEQGDIVAFEKLYRDANSQLYDVISRILSAHNLSEDALQEAFVKIWRNAARFDAERGTPMAWMCRIARNTALDMVRSRRSHIDISMIAVEDLPIIHPCEPENVFISRGLAALPVDQARAIIAMYTYGFSHSELAEYLNVPLGTAKSWVRRGMAGLQQWFSQ